MLLTEKIIIQITPKNYLHYNNLNYNCKCGDIIKINVTDLPKLSKKKVEVKCDICGKIKIIRYGNYTKNINNDNYYSCSNKCSVTKFIKTNQQRYNVTHYNKLPEFSHKAVDTKIKIYGENYPYIFLEKSKITCKEKYGFEFYMQTEYFKEKSNNTNLKLYNTIYPMQNTNILEKTQNTNIELYGFKTPLQNENIKEKINNTKEKLYGDKNYNNREQYIETCNLLYDVDNPMQNKNIKNLLKTNFFKKYGVFHPSQVPEFYEKCIKSGYNTKQYKDTELYYQGTYELDFLNKYYDKFSIIRGLPILYFFENTHHIYYPDFYIKDLNLIIEIKSDKWYNKDFEKNIEKEKTCKKQGYNFLFIINKDYSKFEEYYNLIHSS